MDAAPRDLARERGCRIAMRRVRLIARLDIKGPNLIKGVRLEGLRVIGSPNEHALR